MKVVFIGSGNLATSLAKEIHKLSFTILQIYSRTYESAAILANVVDAKATDNIEEIRIDADLYIFSVKDSILDDLIRRMKPNKGLWVHTSGSIPIDIFNGHTASYGVFYPFQTFNKNRSINFRKIPILIEANNEVNCTLLEAISRKISDKVYKMSSDKRKYLHLTGVFACNFTNHMYSIANRILEKENIPFEILLPLIDETTAKIHSLSPEDAQTGPAVRYDLNIINSHLELLEESSLKSLYTLISDNIHTYSKEKK